jgi:hypothetical protein
MNAIDHPQHYGGDTKYEHVKVVETWGLGYHLGNATKYLSRAGKKGDRIEDLEKALWYLARAAKVDITPTPPNKGFLMPPRNVAEAWGLDETFTAILEEACFGDLWTAIDLLREQIAREKGV